MLNTLFDRLRAADDAACSAVLRALGLRMSRPAMAALIALAAPAGFALALALGGAGVPEAALCALILALWCASMLGGTRPRLLDAAASALLLALLFAARMAALPAISPDCRDYLLVWADVMADLSFPEIMARQVGDYTVFYQYFVYLLARLPLDRVVLYKSFSFAFEALLAWSAASLACIACGDGKDSLRFRGVFLLTLALPTVLLNAAVWAQCDAIYTALALAGMALAMKNRPAAASVLLGLSLCVKLQAVFLLPAVALLLLLRRLSLRHVLLMGLTFLAMAIPAMLGGKGLKAVLTIYLYQMGEYRDLSLNAPNVFALLRDVSLLGADAAARIGVLLALAACGAILLLGAQRREADGALIADVCFALSVCIPFLLPYMHERYFFAADVLSVVCAAIHPRRAYVPLIVVGCSLNGYAAYLLGGLMFPWSAAVPAMALMCLLSVLPLLGGCARPGTQEENPACAPNKE